MDTLKLIIERELNNKSDNTNCPQKNKLKYYLRKTTLRGKKNFVLKREKIFVPIEIRTARKKPACSRQAQKPNKIK